MPELPPGGPADPVNGIGATANALHELYLTLVAAGFTDIQAMYLVGKWVDGTIFRA